MGTLDLSRFYGIDPSCLTSGELESVRHAFATTVVNYAATCRNNSELLDSLWLACDPSKGLQPPYKFGEGSTRRAYSFPFGLCLKLERTDPLDPSEMEWREISESLLHRRRRTANLVEMDFSIFMPGAVPRVYGFVGSFGVPQSNPSALVVQRLESTLSDLRPDDYSGIDKERLFFHTDTGELLTSDTRFMGDRDRPEYLIPEKRYDRIFPKAIEGLWLGNLGIDLLGRRYIIDAGGIDGPDLLGVSATGMLLPKDWKSCPPGSPRHREQTAKIAREKLIIYDCRRTLLGLQ